MCGIVGCAGVDAQPDRSWLSVARDTLTTRGPDDAGEWWSDDGRVGLAHRRLSILDLSPLGHQPMHIPERGLTVAYNGEIYNYTDLRNQLAGKGHRFQSDCDTEVLLAAYAEWGADCVKKLNGMFAFALYDRIRQQVILARDRVGEKPLFYRAEGNYLFFASELKALLANPAMPRRIDAEALDCYLALGYIPGHRCILEGYHKLPPAHVLIFDIERGSVATRQYWVLPEFEDRSGTEAAALVDQLDELLDTAVKRQLRADV